MTARSVERDVLRLLIREAADEAVDYVGEIPLDVSRALFFWARMIWQVRGPLRRRLVAVARSLMGRHRLPPFRALSIAARRLDIPRKPSVAHPGRVTSTQVKAMRRKMGRLPRHKDPRLRHTSKGRRLADMAL
jgi:hypothetical protein